MIHAPVSTIAACICNEPANIIDDDPTFSLLANDGTVYQ